MSCIASAPESIVPIDAVAATLEAVGAGFQQRREYSRRRQAVIDANPELQERELIMLASIASAIAGALPPARRERPGRKPDRRGGNRRL